MRSSTRFAMPRSQASLYTWGERPCVAIWQQIQGGKFPFAASRRWQGPGFIVVSQVQPLSLVDIGDTWYTSVLVKRITRKR